MTHNRHCYTIEIRCPYECIVEYLDQRARDKVQKYKPLLKELSQVNCNTGKVISLVIGAMGTITDTTNKQLKQLKLTRQKEALQITVIKGSVNILNHHFRRDDFDKRGWTRVVWFHREIMNYDDSKTIRWSRNDGREIITRQTIIVNNLVGLNN